VPLVHHEDWNAFAAAQPRGALWVAVEMGGEPLETFEHPERAVYILGSEDTGLPDSVARACHRHVALPSVRYASFNVAVAGSIVLYDRFAKQQRKGKGDTELVPSLSEDATASAASAALDLDTELDAEST